MQILFPGRRDTEAAALHSYRQSDSRTCVDEPASHYCQKARPGVTALKCRSNWVICTLSVYL